MYTKLLTSFRDMYAERDHLVNIVFPKLREKLKKHHIHLVDINLCWGVRNIPKVVDIRN